MKTKSLITSVLFAFYAAFFLISVPKASASSNPNAHLLILEEIQKSIQKDFKLEGKMKTVVTYPPEPNEKPPKIKKELSPGQKKVQEMLKKNRMKIRQKQGMKGSPLSGKDRVKEMLRLNRQKIKGQRTAKDNQGTTQSNDWISKKQNELNNWQNARKKQIRTWEKEKKEIIAKWYKERQKFLKRVPQYKKNLTPIPVPKEAKLAPAQITKMEQVSKIIKKKPKIRKKVEKHITMPVFSDYYIIDQALNLPVKDQGKRPTCAAFAGIRAMEILLSQKKTRIKNLKLSEQYFFWASKPKCQRSPCPKQGSWVLQIYRKSQNSSSPDIPRERDCPYNKKSRSGNVTQTPLPSGCQQGTAKVENFYMVKSTPEILRAIKNGHPVISGFRLSQNFYKNTGHVFSQNASTNPGKMDSHAAGHAILLVGHMKLPPKLHAKEGRFCLITANSWGTGWGKGGHACLSEKWIERFRYDVPFIALESVGV